MTSMDLVTIRDMCRANALTHPVDRVIIDHLVEKIQGEVSWLHQQVWQLTAEECQRDLALPPSSEENTYATEAKDLIALLWMAIEKSKADMEWCRSLCHPSPIRTLPLEVLSHIFAFAGIGDSYDVVEPRRHVCRPAGHSLIHVCKFWRDIALQTKELWTHPIIVNNHHTVWGDFVVISGYGAEKSISRFAGVIDLYGRNLTHIILHCRYISYHLRRLFDKTISCLHQLIYLDIIGPSDEVYSSPFDFGMPVLKRLFIPIPVKEDHGRDRSTGITFNTPRLKEVFLYVDEESTSDPKCLHLPWQQVTRLSIGLPHNHITLTKSPTTRPPVPTLLRVLLEARNLVYLHLTCLVPGEYLTGAITLPRLKTLEIHDQGLQYLIGVRGELFEDATHFPFTLSAPSLEKFDLAFSVKPTVHTGHADSLYHGQVHCETIHRIGALLQDSPRLSQVRIMLCSPREFMGQSSNGSTGIPVGEVTAGRIFRIAGESATFTRLNAACRVWEGSDGKFNISSPNVREARYKETLDCEIWVDRFLDRFMEECPGPHVRFTRSYSQVEYVVINAILGLFGESGGLPHCQKQLYLAP